MDFNVSTEALVIALVIGAALVFVFIFLLRMFLRKKSHSDLTEKYKDKVWKSPIEGRNKYPDVDVFKMSGSLVNFGLASALALMILAFSWTTYEEVVDIPEDALEFEEDIEVVTPRTAEPPPPPPPPPPPVIQEVPEEEFIEEEQVEFVDQSVEEETVVEAPPEVKEEAPPPPPPPPPPAEEEIFKVVEEMPRFPGCEDSGGTMKEKKECADKKMLQFIYKNIKYPAIARENGVEGTVVIQFVVDKDGSISNARAVRDIGAQCGQEALRVVELMNTKGLKWAPGKQRGQSVRVQFNLPVKFRLE
ncbi:MAG: energy transducer TonB [Bacteroidetes bacterium]|nr:energy transducer TonB [Bacteroidota bacterium]